MTQSSLLTLMIAYFQLIGIGDTISNTENYATPKDVNDETNDMGYQLNFYLTSKDLLDPKNRIKIYHKVKDFVFHLVNTLDEMSIPYIDLVPTDLQIGTYKLTIHFKIK